jgi:hypothetical protein
MLNLTNIEEIDFSKYGRLRMDIGTSVCAPNSALWFSKYNNLLVIGAEPHPDCIQALRLGPESTHGFVDPWHLVIDSGTIHAEGGRVISRLKDQNNEFCLIEGAIDLQEKILPFYCTGNGRWAGCSSLHKPIDGRGIPSVSKVVEVNTIPLWRIMEKIDWDKVSYVEFLKIDTQSNDLNVIKSAKEYIEKVCFVQAEYYTNGEYEGEGDMQGCFDDMVDYMKNYNFQPYAVTSTDLWFVNKNMVSIIQKEKICDDSYEFPSGPPLYQWVSLGILHE